jgi:hypothetical protein
MGIEAELQRFADRFHTDKQVFGLLEDLREVIFNYQVCS